MTKKAVDYIILVFCVVIAVLLFRSTAKFPEITQHNTAAYIRFLAMSMAILSLIQIVNSYRSKTDETVEFYKDKKRFFRLIASLVGYIVLIDFFGFMLSTAAFLPVTMLLMGHKKIRTVILASAGLLLFLQLLFVTLLQVPLPRGMLFG